MRELYVFAEGQTEAAFVATVLAPNLQNVGIPVVHPVVFKTSHRGGKTHRGGTVTYRDMRKQIFSVCRKRTSSELIFTTMIDVYGLPRRFPGAGDARQYRSNPYERVRVLESAFAADIDDRRFLPYLQLYEFETLLFVEPERLGDYFDSRREQIDELKRVVERFGCPELINDGTTSAPSKRIIGQLPDYAESKSSVAPQIVQRIGLDALRAACPHFHEWLTQLEQIATTDG